MKTPKIFKITLAAMLGLTAFGAGMYALNNDFTVQAEENTESVRVDTSAFERIENAEYLRYQIVMGLTPNYKTRIYPDGYNLTDHDNILDSKTPFIGTYILTGDNSDGTLFFYGNEDGTPQEYNVILHDFIAVGDVNNPVVLQIGKNVTLNISVYGVNQIQGYDMPAIERMDLEGLEELTLDEKEALSGYASVNFRAMDKSKLVLGIDNTSGSRSQYGIDEKVWNDSNEQYEDIGDSHRFGRTIAKGVATDAHEIKYQAREDGLSCEAYCDECDVVFADFTHEWTPGNDGKVHTMVCLDCGTVKNAEHNIENGVCVDCNVNIRVTIGAEETYYASFADALEATSGQESAEIKLLGNVEDVDEWVGTKLTLDLNGFTMSNTALHISDAVEGASLIIKDTSEAQTGTVKGRSGLGWGLYNGKNEIQGGYFDENVGFFLDHNNAIELKISGGHFEYLDVGIENSSSVIIDGATANEVHFSGYGDGSLEVKSLSFQYWWQDSDDNEGAFIHSISDCLADGYKIIDQNGVFVDYNTSKVGRIDWDSEKEETIYYDTFTVVEHLTCTYDTLYNDETHHWYACACGATEGELVKEEHKGSKATCIAKAVCEVCEATYGDFDLAQHNVENNTCVDCKTEFSVKVTIGEEITYYASFADALEATSGQESAEIKLLGNVEGVDEWVRTRLTLDLNGFTMSNTALHISDAVEGASLIIKDTSEAQTGTVKGHAGYGWGLYNGKNEIQGGYFDENVVFYMDYNAIELKISGGHFEGLDVGIKNSSSVIIDGATANEVHFSGYGDGSLEVKNLSFQYWWQDSDDNEGAFIHSISDCLADGYKIIDENGAFVDFGGETLGLLDWDSETGEYIYYNTFTVVDHSTCKNELQSDETHHWYACACGATEDGSEIVKEEHKGGTATCQTLAVCDVCGNKYGETADHVASETWEKDDTHHWHLCVGDETCEEILDKAEHACGEWTVTKEATQEEKGEKTRSCECGYTETEDIDVLPPDEDTASDTTSDTDSDVSDTTSDTASDTASSTPNDTTDDVPAKEGCGSVVGGGTALLMIGAAAVVLAIRKRKED